MSGQTSTRGLVTGVGLGLVGVVTKPLSGAAELVALTGQGLLQGTGWNSMPSVCIVKFDLILFFFLHLSQLYCSAKGN